MSRALIHPAEDGFACARNVALAGLAMCLGIGGFLALRAGAWPGGVGLPWLAFAFASAWLTLERR